MRPSLKIPSHIAIIGGGQWGHALASVLQHDFKNIEFINKTTRYWDKTISPETLCILSLPFKALRNVLERLTNIPKHGVLNASKGIDRTSLCTFSQMAKEYLSCPYATLSGPTFAKEVLQKKPTACVIASSHSLFTNQICRLFSRPYFRVYSSSDPIGVEICGALKNVFAIACGISDGLHLGYNARAALLARSLQEMKFIVKSLGGKQETVFGLAGMGDLCLTATSSLSRNRQFGIYLAQGLKPSQALKKIKGPVEGYYTIHPIYSLKKKYKLELPICEQVDLICKGKQNPVTALHALMTRELKAEEAT